MLFIIRHPIIFCYNVLHDIVSKNMDVRGVIEYWVGQTNGRFNPMHHPAYTSANRPLHRGIYKYVVAPSCSKPNNVNTHAGYRKHFTVWPARAKEGYASQYTHTRDFTFAANTPTTLRLGDLKQFKSNRNSTKLIREVLYAP